MNAGWGIVSTRTDTVPPQERQNEEAKNRKTGTPHRQVERRESKQSENDRKSHLKAFGT